MLGLWIRRSHTGREEILFERSPLDRAMVSGWSAAFGLIGLAGLFFSTHPLERAFNAVLLALSVGLCCRVMISYSLTLVPSESSLRIRTPFRTTTVPLSSLASAEVVVRRVPISARPALRLVATTGSVTNFDVISSRRQERGQRSLQLAADRVNIHIERLRS